MKNLIITLIILVGNSLTAQTIIKYKMPDGQIFSKEVFIVLRESFENQNLEYKITDSTIVDNALTRIIDVLSKMKNQ